MVLTENSQIITCHEKENMDIEKPGPDNSIAPNKLGYVLFLRANIYCGYS